MRASDYASSDGRGGARWNAIRALVLLTIALSFPSFLTRTIEKDRVPVRSNGSRRINSRSPDALSACFSISLGISALPMPILLNPRHERFAQELAAGNSAHKSHVVAGYSDNRRNAATLSHRPDIVARTTELLEMRQRKADKASDRAIEKASLSREWVLTSLRANYERALQTDQGAVANKALELLGKEIGMFITRSEQGPPGAFAELNDGQLREAIASAIHDTGADATVVASITGIQPANTNEGRDASDEDCPIAKAS